MCLLKKKKKKKKQNKQTNVFTSYSQMVPLGYTKKYNKIKGR